MIRNEKEAEITRGRLAETERALAQQRSALEAVGLSVADIKRGLDPMECIRAQLMDELTQYERARRRDFEPIMTLTGIGQLLIAARIANGLTQRDLADRLGVNETQVSRDERNDYHGITVDRAQRILDCMNETVTVRLESKATASVA